MSGGLSQAALARAIGLSPAMIVKLKGKGMPVHSVEAAQAWRSTNQRTYFKPDGVAGPAAVFQPTKPGAPPPLTEAGDEAVPDFKESRARREAAEADKAEMEAAKMRGDLVERGSVRREFEAAASRVREALLQLPDRVAPVLEQRPLGFIRQTLDTEIRAALEALAAK